jgi:hypothetical protein
MLSIISNMSCCLTAQADCVPQVVLGLKQGISATLCSGLSALRFIAEGMRDSVYVLPVNHFEAPPGEGWHNGV